MKITFAENEGRLEAKLSESSDVKLFVAFANAIANEFDISWIRKLKGLDQRYWDFKLNNCDLTLHLEHYLGISLFPTSKTNAMNIENGLVRKITDYLINVNFEEES